MEKIFHIMEKIFPCQMERIFPLDILHGDHRKTCILLPLIAPRARACVCVRACAREEFACKLLETAPGTAQKGQNPCSCLRTAVRAGTMGRGEWLVKKRCLRPPMRTPVQARLVLKGRLRLWRRSDLELSQAAMAMAAGVSRNTVRRWEDARSTALPSVAHLAAICAATREDPADAARWLMGGG